MSDVDTIKDNQRIRISIRYILILLNYKKRTPHKKCSLNWLRELDSNQRPSGYEPDELPLLHPAISKYQLISECLYIIAQCLQFVKHFLNFFLIIILIIYGNILAAAGSTQTAVKYVITLSF